MLNIQKEIDFVATDLSLTYARSFVIDYTYPYTNDPIALWIPYPQLDTSFFGIVKPFKYEVINFNVSLIKS